MSERIESLLSKVEVLKHLFEGVNEDDTDFLLRELVRQLGYGVVTPDSAYPVDTLLCDPVIWVDDDLEVVSYAEWDDAAYKTMSQRLTEEGQEIKRILSSHIQDENNNKEENI
jgi:hypothetical protein